MTDLPPGVTTSVERDTVSATTIVDASPEAVFDYVCHPSNHDAISGDDSVKGVRVGPEVLTDGAKFGMRMKLFGVPYSITSQVKEFEKGRRIAWAHFNGHRWRWEVEPAEDGRTELTETFDLSTARFPPILRAMGFPKRHEPNVATSVANVAAHFTGTA